MRLFAEPGSEAVTVAAIAEAASMTSAAVYYHFASKDEILLEGLRTVGEALVAKTTSVAREINEEGVSIGQLPVRLLTWFDDRPAEATVWFVTSSGVSLAVEQLRRELRAEMLSVLTVAGRAARPGLSAAEAAVVATALLALIETAASAWLTDDASLTGLGRKKFLEEVCRLAERITGV
jgi:AcrR family transcriptional regulator